MNWPSSPITRSLRFAYSWVKNKQVQSTLLNADTKGTDRLSQSRSFVSGSGLGVGPGTSLFSRRLLELALILALRARSIALVPGSYVLAKVYFLF